MKKDILEKVEIPQGIGVEIDHDFITIKFEDKEIKKRFNHEGISLEKKGEEFVLESKKATKREAKVIGTIKSHLKNMIQGVQEGFEYKLALEYVHFPFTIEISGNDVIVKNFLGEKKPRKGKLIPGVEVIIEKNEITVKSHDKEIAGQMAANLEKMTFVKERDRRKFQDGIYITEKCGRAI
ncbi:MAG: 50S ribosomal protein L6 [Nanoarchaeota archaeon]|nr:50S ribosomal protein L6 [Nanoarchaeota archaeon]